MSNQENKKKLNVSMDFFGVSDTLLREEIAIIISSINDMV